MDKKFGADNEINMGRITLFGMLVKEIYTFV
jgi:hypothetical protein